MKTVKRCFVFLLAAAAAVLLLISFRDQRQTVSVYENRALAAHPAFSLRGLWDGSYFDGWDAYFSDHVAWRDDMMRDYLWLQLYAKRQVVAQDVVIGDGALLPYLPYTDYSGYDYDSPARAAVQRLLPIQQAAEARGGVFLYLGIDEQRSALREAYPAYLYNKSDYFDASEAAFRAAAEEAGLSVLFTRDLWTEEDCRRYYSAVDHHYNLLGAQAAWRALLAWCASQDMELPAPEEAELNIRSWPGDFYGSYSRRFYDLSPITEELLVFDDSVLPPYERWDDGERTDAPVLVLPEAGAHAQYTAYMGGDHGETVIRTDRPALPNILIVGDSFTNPLEALCVCSFNEVRSLDFRHYDAMTLTEYLETFPADVVIVVRDNLNYLLQEGNGDLK